MQMFLLLCFVYMLLASWDVDIGKNCDRGLENAALGHFFLG